MAVGNHWNHMGVWGWSACKKLAIRDDGVKIGKKFSFSFILRQSTTKYDHHLQFISVVRQFLSEFQAVADWHLNLAKKTERLKIQIIHLVDRTDGSNKSYIEQQQLRVPQWIMNDCWCTATWGRIKVERNWGASVTLHWNHQCLQMGPCCTDTRMALFLWLSSHRFSS